MRGEVQAIAKGGAGIVRHEGRAVFVPGTLPGEKIEFSIAGSARSVLRGRLERILEPSPRRVVSSCPHYETCGGCNLQHAGYDLQLEIKQSILADNLRRLAGRTWAAIPVHASPPFRYRTRVTFRVAGGRVGMLRRSSHDIVPLLTCRLVPEAVEAFALRELRLPADSEGELTVLSDGKSVSARFGDCAGKRLLTTLATLDFSIAGYRFRPGPSGFIQSNLFQLERMIDLAREGLAGMKTDCALDLFSGAGFFTLPLAAHARRLYSVENDPDSVETQQANLEANGLSHVQVMSDNGLRAALPRAGLAIVDPPRGGLGPGLAHRLSAAGVKRLLYFSCDSATFARDLKLLENRGFALADLQLIDNFPQTDHFEIYSRFEHR
jgi:23S rRNA (uracil1939-C5)-methyltransferase